MNKENIDISVGKIKPIGLHQACVIYACRLDNSKDTPGVIARSFATLLRGALCTVLRLSQVL